MRSDPLSSLAKQVQRILASDDAAQGLRSRRSHVSGKPVTSSRPQAQAGRLVDAELPLPSRRSASPR